MGQITNLFMLLMAAWMAVFEGYPVTGSRAWRNRNPGNLRRWGDLPRVGGFAVFPSHEAGWRALLRQVQLNIGRGLTLREFFAGKPGVYPGYAPAADGNDPAAYARFISEKTGIPVDSVRIRDYIEAIARQFTPTRIL